MPRVGLGEFHRTQVTQIISDGSILGQGHHQDLLLRSIQKTEFVLTAKRQV